MRSVCNFLLSGIVKAVAISKKEYRSLKWLELGICDYQLVVLKAYQNKVLKALFVTRRATLT